MQLKTIVNRIERFKSFAHGKTRWADGVERPTIEIEVEARKNGRRSARAAGRYGRATTVCRSGVSSSSRCGGSPFSSSIPCGG